MRYAERCLLGGGWDLIKHLYTQDYAKAQDCFRTALAVRPDVSSRKIYVYTIQGYNMQFQDWQLYNRVGATLANSGSAEEALQYYYRALELNPAYIRARSAWIITFLLQPSDWSDLHTGSI